MASSRLEGAFPNLKPGEYKITSPKTPKYNCIAWAAGKTNKWWQPPHPFLGAPAGSYWPPDIPAGTTPSGVARAFELQGYEVCENADLEAGFEKVAIYVDALGKYTHAARQLDNGAWTSKLGGWEDIQHDTVEALEGRGHAYGTATRFLKRRRKR